MKKITVSLNFNKKPITVGHLAIKNRTIYFEYAQSFIESNIEISPFKLPLKSGVQSSDQNLFEGLPGVFNDSLPDGWGRLLLDRAVKAQGILASELSPLDRLSFVGKHGMGALTYEPTHEIKHSSLQQLTLDALANNAKSILKGETSKAIEEMLALNGSSAGARPKAIIYLDPSKQQLTFGSHHCPKNHEAWLVKFANSIETIDIGAIEYVYSEMAKMSGINMMETSLLPAKNGPGYFATKRFDCQNQKRLHVLSACGLLHSDFRTPCLDYADLMRATELLTKNKQESLKLFRLAVFNILAHNQDDHSKNVSFIMDETGTWQFAPAYDLTFSSGMNGEQSTMIMGKGRNIEKSDFTDLGKLFGIHKQEVLQIIDHVKHGLSHWETLSKNVGVQRENVLLIAKKLHKTLQH